MKSIRWFELCMLLGSYNCAAVAPPPTASTGATEDELVPLELPAGYEDKVKSLVPELLDRLGIPSGLVIGSGLLSSVSNLSSGFGYFKSGTDSEQDSACKSKLVEDGLKLTKYGVSMCKKRCLDERKQRVSLIRSTLETIYGGNNEKRIEADIEVRTEKKAYECVLNSDRYDCVCMKNEVLKVTPSLKSLIYQLFQGGDKRRDLIPDHSVGKILMLILLFLAEKSIEAVAAPVLVPLKLIYHIYHALQWIT